MGRTRTSVPMSSSHRSSTVYSKVLRLKSAEIPFFSFESCILSLYFQPTEHVDMPLISNKDVVSGQIMEKIDLIRKQTEVSVNSLARPKLKFICFPYLANPEKRPYSKNLFQFSVKNIFFNFIATQENCPM